MLFRWRIITQGKLKQPWHCLSVPRRGSTHAVKNVVLVHGAFADAAGWSKTISLLHAKGLHVVSVQNSLTSFADDVALARQVIAA
jgi:alpha-beta hydrolase superfamily lysophospholipase